MGLTEGHWFEDEEPELTEDQLEDILWKYDKIFERGYQKGFSDGKLTVLSEQEPVRPRWTHPAVGTNVLMCGGCGIEIPLGKPNYCPWCGKAVKWDD